MKKKINDMISDAVNLEIDEMSLISDRTKQILLSGFKGLDELDLVIKTKRDEEKCIKEKSKDKDKE